MPDPKYVEEISSAAMLAVKRSAGITTEVNTYASASANKAAHCGFETQRRCHQKSKTNLSVAPQQGLGKLKKKQTNLPMALARRDDVIYLATLDERIDRG